MLTASFPDYKGHSRAQFMYPLVKAISEEGVSLSVVAPFYKESKKKNEILDNIKFYRFQYFYPHKMQVLAEDVGIAANLKQKRFSALQLPFFMLSFFWRSLWTTKKCDLIHAQWTLAGFIGVILKYIYKKPLLITIRGADLNMSLGNNLLKKLMMFTFKHANFVTSNNQQCLDTIIKLGLPAQKTLSIPNGFDLDIYKPADKIKARKELNLPLGKKIVLFVGFLIKRKGPDYLISAIPQVISREKDAFFVFVGDGIMLNELKAMVKNLNIEDYVLFVGKKSPIKIPSYLNASDIFILPSLSEGRPNVVGEAMVCGIPVIATKVNGTPEFIKDGSDSILIDKMNSDQIWKNILNLLRDNELRIKMGKLARQSMLDKDLTWKRSAKKLVGLYQEIIENVWNLRSSGA